MANHGRLKSTNLPDVRLQVTKINCAPKPDPHGCKSSWISQFQMKVDDDPQHVGSILRLVFTKAGLINFDINTTIGGMTLHCSAAHRAASHNTIMVTIIYTRN